MSQRRGRPSSKSTHLPEAQRLYRDEKMSLVEVGRALGVSTQTVSRWFQEEAITLESRIRNPNLGRLPAEQERINALISVNRVGKGTGPRTAVETRVCAECRAPFTVKVTSVARYCGRPCARAVDGREKRARTELAWYASDQSLCECGQRIPYANRHDWRYCSVECSSTYGKKRQIDPAKWSTLTCRTCGKEFEQRLSSQSAGMFCSNECAAKHTKVKRHYIVRDMDMVLDSGWEALFVGLCKFLKITVERIDRGDAVEWSPGHWYAPDLFLPDYGISIEIKGQEDIDDPAKWAAWRSEKGSLAVVDQGVLDLLRCAKDVAQALTILSDAVI